MDSIIINGGRALAGTVRVQGSKNAVLPMMAAAVLHDGITVLKGCPHISDVYFMAEILKCLGAGVCWQGHTLRIDGSGVRDSVIPAIYGVQMRSSVTLMGSLIGRMNRFEMPYPGGCIIGRRPVDLHIQVLKALGAEVEEKEGVLRAACDGIRGFTHVFTKKSVGATENAVLAAVRASGSTYLYGCSIEPEIVWMCRLLEKMGVKIQGIGTANLIIEGTWNLKDVAFTVPADRIVAGTYLLAGAATRGCITLEGAPVEEMAAVLDVYEKMGGQYEASSGKLVADSRKVCYPLPFVETEVYPGLPTDLQSQLVVVLSGIRGRSLVRENVFEDRYKIVPQLARMGARIEIKGRDARISGVNRLHGNKVFARELRGGAALVIAALSAQGESQIWNPHYIERGYEDICKDIGALGGDIRMDKDDSLIWGKE